MGALRTRHTLSFARVRAIKAILGSRGHYFDVFVHYAKATPESILIEISVFNRGPETAPLHVLPTLWFRNTWAWWPAPEKPVLRELEATTTASTVVAWHEQLGERFLYCEGNVPLLFTENETNNMRLFGTPNDSSCVKDGINDYIVHGRTSAVNASRTGTKAAAHYQVSVGPGKMTTIR